MYRGKSISRECLCHEDVKYDLVLPDLSKPSRTGKSMLQDSIAFPVGTVRMDLFKPLLLFRPDVPSYSQQPRIIPELPDELHASEIHRIFLVLGKSHGDTDGR